MVSFKFKFKIGILIILCNYFSTLRAQSITEIECSGEIVNCLYADDVLNLLYASCMTYNSNGTKSSSIQKWNGSSWQEIASTIDGEVKTMIKVNGNLIIGGSFNYINGSLLKNIAEWKEANWNAIGAEGLGTSGCIINSLCLFNDTLIAGGNFGKNAINNLFRWNGTSWLPFQQFIDGNVLSLCNFNNTLYICGDIEYIDTLKIHGIAKLSDDSWANLSDSIKGKVFNMSTCDGQLYFSGLFGYINENPSGIIASYNGITINGLGDGVTCFITAMHSFENKLYIAGEFIDADGVSTQKIVSWNGSSWQVCSFNLNNISQITSISHYGNSIIIAGHLNVNNNARKIMQNIQQ